MKIQELLQGLIDDLDGMEHTTGNPRNSTTSAQGGLVPAFADNTDNTEAEVFVPPLQASLELQKREAGVDSIYDSEDECVDLIGADYEEESDGTDELNAITRLAGFPQEPIVAITQSSTPF
jgi:hypothetical protein